jgi:hypothetical protein
MARIRRYDDSPKLASLYARTVAAAWRSPANDGDPVALELSRVRVDPQHLAAYNAVTGFAGSDVLPATYPHVLAFPLHLDLMSDPSFSHKPMGIVHLGNTITQKQPLPVDAELSIHVHSESQRPHPKGTVFDVVSEVSAGGSVLWIDRTTLLSRGPGNADAAVDLLPDPALEPTAEWRLKANLGRQYAAVSGDRNPIHLFKLTAQAFGFPRQIAHGMWAKAACLASLEPPEAFTVRVDFRKPLLLPSTVRFGAADGSFAVYGKDVVHLIGRLDPA